MATLFKPTRSYPLPADAVTADRDGRPHVCLRDKGKAVWYPLSKDGTQYLKPIGKWCADVRHADGRVKRVRFSPHRDAAAVMLADLLKRIENEKAGVVDRFADHRKRAITAHVEDWLASLRANGRGPDYVALKASRVRAVIDGCGWALPNDMNANRLETFLNDLRSRRPELPPMPSGREWFTPAETARLLGAWASPRSPN